MALLAAAGACSAPCAGAIAAVTGGSVVAPVVAVGLTTVASIQMGRRAVRSLMAKSNDSNSDDEEFEDALEDEEETDESSARRITTTVDERLQEAGGRAGGTDLAQPVAPKASSLGASFL
mmetsp:Transcript_1497/g.1418  ORF Transcript_1497/g.1418 Transcript_1497/m.1418 type:complete len:120 (+) Transcript_1497:3-362(+)